jgi:hypothetical protein
MSELTKEELSDALMEQAETTPSDVPTDDPLAMTDVAAQAITNLGPSARQFGQDILQTVLHPIETAKNIGDLGKGVYQLFTPGEQPDEAKARAVGQFFADRYGGGGLFGLGWENIKKTMAQDPVGFLADLSMIVTGGGMAAARAPGYAGRVGKVVQAAGLAIDPVNIAAKTTAKVGGVIAAPIAGALTGVGADAFKIANAAARAGGTQAKAFLDNLRPGRNVPVSRVLDMAKEAVLELKKARQTAYLNDMLPIKDSKIQLTFDGIDKSMGELATSGTYKGIEIRGSKPQKVFQEIQAKIDEFKNLGPENSRAVDFDQMKQAIGGIRDNVNVLDNPRAWDLANDIYGKIRKTIGDQDPSYFKVMEEYMEASDLITDIEKTFALKGRKTNVDTALRKLQSIMRNNVNTSYGRRAELGESIAATKAAKDLLPALAGQSLQPWTSRGIGIPSKGLLAMALGTLSPAPLVGYPFTMPRVMGEATYLASKYGGGAARAAARGAPAAYQAGRAERVAGGGRELNADALSRALLRSN